MPESVLETRARTADEEYRQAIRHAEECLLLNLDMAESAYKASVIFVGSDSVQVGFPDGAVLTDGVVTAVNTYLGQLVGASARYVIGVPMPFIDAQTRLHAEVDRLTAQAHEHKWGMILERFNLDEADPASGRRWKWGDIWRLEIEPGVRYARQEALDLLLSEPADAHDSDELDEEQADDWQVDDDVSLQASPSGLGAEMEAGRQAIGRKGLIPADARKGAVQYFMRVTCRDIQPRVTKKDIWSVAGDCQRQQFWLWETNKEGATHEGAMKYCQVLRMSPEEFKAKRLLALAS